MYRLLIIFQLFAVSICYGQTTTYTFTQSAGTPGYVYDETGATTILDESAAGADVLSTWQTLPFAWDFYGTPVTGYFASDNGYITFDSTATVSYNNNTDIPDTGTPNSAIYAAWDDWDLKYTFWTGDKVKTVTKGTAPNRVHIIQWVGVTMGGGGQNDWGFFAIRIYESGGFDIVHDAFNGGAWIPSSVTVGVENSDATKATKVMGPNAQVVFGSPSSSTDGFVWSFAWTVQLDYDLVFDEIRLPRTLPSGNFYLEGVVTNLGYNTVTSYDVTYVVNNTDTVHASISGVSIPSYSVDTFKVANPYVIGKPGDFYDIQAWTENINGFPDQDLTNNDTLSGNLFNVNGNTAPKQVLIEEFTATWCTPCIAAIYHIDSIKSVYEDTVHVVAFHGTHDPMETSIGKELASTYGVAYPNALIDRELYEGQKSINIQNSLVWKTWLNLTAYQLNTWTPVEVIFDNGSSLNMTTGELSVNVKAKFYDYAIPGDLRFVLYVVEDQITEPGNPDYYQSNALSGSTYYPWIPYANMPNPIPDFTHKHVFRDSPNLWGNPNVISSSPSPNDVFTETITTTLDNSWDQDSLSIIAYVYYYDPYANLRYILNSEEMHIRDLIASIDDKVITPVFKIFPNPVSDDKVFVSISLEKNENVTIEVFDILGNVQEIYTEKNYQTGASKIPISVKNLSDGIYLIRVTIGGVSNTQKICVSK